MSVLQAITVLALVAVHLFAEKLRFLEGLPRSRWLSFAGGISVAYVFVHLFPELAEVQEHLSSHWEALDSIKHHAYIVAMLGLATFYGLERMVKVSGKGGEAVPNEIFWIHIASFALYNALIGYLLVDRPEADAGGLVLYAIAMAMHFVVNDFGLQQHHREVYRRAGRWVLAGSVVVGGIIGTLANLDDGLVAVLFAYLAGGIVLNVLKEELPEERKSRFIPFLLGIVSFASLLLVI